MSLLYSRFPSISHVVATEESGEYTVERSCLDLVFQSIFTIGVREFRGKEHLLRYLRVNLHKRLRILSEVWKCVKLSVPCRPTD